jgi:hypothetical protein
MDETRSAQTPDRSGMPEDSGAAEDAEGLPPEAIEEAQRWDDVPVQEPEESTGIDV